MTITSSCGSGTVSINVAFESFPAAQQALKELKSEIVNPTIGFPLKPYVISHIAGETTLFNLRDVVAVTIVDRTQEDSAHLHDIPYISYIDRAEEELNEEYKNYKIGIKIQ